MAVNRKKILIAALNFLGEKTISLLTKHKMHKSERERRVSWVKLAACSITSSFFPADFADLLSFNTLKFFSGEVDFNEN